MTSLPIASTFKLDSGATSHFYDTYKATLLSTPTSPTNPPIRVVVPTGATMESTSTALLPIPTLPPTATQAHGFPHLASGSLLSVGQLCDHQCTAIFTADTAAVYPNRNLTVTNHQSSTPAMLSWTSHQENSLNTVTFFALLNETAGPTVAPKNSPD